jgi:hypothetical protein
VASRLDLEPSYVSRVPRGKRQSEVIIQALGHEMSRIMGLLEFNRRPRHHAANRIVMHRRRIQTTERPA